MNKFLGIIGGMGPLASSYFYEMVVRKTNAKCDQEHIDMVIFNHASIPDRTAYILGGCDESPLPLLLEDVSTLSNMGASLLFIPCNTSHYFYDKLKSSTDVPILNMIEDTIKYVRDSGIQRVLILSTEGTTKSRLYQNMCELYGIEYKISDESLQSKITNIIYNNVKSGKMITINDWSLIIEPYKDVDAYILGCTELSILKGELGLSDEFIDPLEIEAENVIKFFGKERSE